MKSPKLLSLFLAGSMLAACGETIDEPDLPPDPEFGLETLDGKDDSFAIRPGSPEAEAVVAYVNREIANDAEGVAFRDEIDTKLHATAAKNIAMFRAGDDGSFGTDDDRVFEDLAQLDAVRYVGRTALMQLFVLAEAAGYFQRGSLDCADYVDHDRWNNYTIDSYADLLEYENSRCTTIEGNLTIQISGTDLLPPAARSIRNLRHLRTINGELRIVTSDHFHSIHFESLESVTGMLRAESPEGRKHTLEFTALRSAKSLHLSAIQSSLFPALEQNDQIELVDTDLEGFTALKDAKLIEISQRARGSWNVSFPALTQVDALRFDVARRNAWTDPEVSFTGGFPKLKKGTSLEMTNGIYTELAFPRLTELEWLNTTTTVDPYVGMSKLARVGDLSSNRDQFAAEVHAGPAMLATVGGLYVATDLPIVGYNALETAEANIALRTASGVEGFNALALMGGSIDVSAGQSGDEFNLSGFNELSDVRAILISANNAPVVIGPLFEKLENTQGRLSLVGNQGFAVNPVFKKLVSIGGDLRVDALKEGLDMMPLLEIVDGSVEINRTPTELTGFPRLERIEGSLTLKASMDTMTGMADLVAIGGNLSVPRTLPSAELDDFLNRLTEFSGTIRYN